MTGKSPKGTSRVRRGPRISLTRMVVLPTASVMALGASTFGLVLSAPASLSPAPAGPAAVTQVEATTVVADDSIAAGVPINGPASISRPLKVGAKTDGLVRAAVGSGPASEIPTAALSAYQRAESIILAADESCGIRWQLLAAIGEVESNHGRFGGSALDTDGVATPAIIGLPLNGKSGTRRIVDTDAGEYDGDQKLDRAVGPMQFIPSTWSVVGVDADGDGVRNPQDIDDAALGSAVYLCSGDEDLSTDAGVSEAVFRYNRSNEYVDLVLSLMRQYEQNSVAALPDTEVAAGYAIPAPGADKPARVMAARPNAQKPDKLGEAGKKPGKNKPARSKPAKHEPSTHEPSTSKGPKKDQSSASASPSASGSSKPGTGGSGKPNSDESASASASESSQSSEAKPSATKPPAPASPAPTTPPPDPTEPPATEETVEPDLLEDECRDAGVVDEVEVADCAAYAEANGKPAPSPLSPSAYVTAYATCVESEELSNDPDDADDPFDQCVEEELPDA